MSFDKTKIYSAVNADELKAGDKVYVADSLKQLRRKVECNDTTNFFGFLEFVYGEEYVYRFKLKGHDYSLAYLVERAAEKKWRPFKDIQELIDAWIRITSIPHVANTMPLIWVEGKTSHTVLNIDAFCKDAIYVGDEWLKMPELFESYTFLDGSPCGIKE